MGSLNLRACEQLRQYRAAKRETANRSWPFLFSHVISSRATSHCVQSSLDRLVGSLRVSARLVTSSHGWSVLSRQVSSYRLTSQHVASVKSCHYKSDLVWPGLVISRLFVAYPIMPWPSCHASLMSRSMSDLLTHGSFILSFCPQGRYLFYYFFNALLKPENSCVISCFGNVRCRKAEFSIKKLSR